MSGPSRGGSSDGEYDDDALVTDAPAQQQPYSVTTHPDLNANSSSHTTPLGPVPKRRRVTRACDECRRKKIKCDGKQPCTHCTVYSYECTYDQPSNRRRNPAPQYVESLEIRLARAETLLKTVLPEVDLDDPNLDTGNLQNATSIPKHEARSQQPGHPKPWASLENGRKAADGEKDSMLESMVQNTGSLDLDDEGNWDFHGHSSGRAFLRRMREQFGDLMGKPNVTPWMNYNPGSSRTQLVESPTTLLDSPMDRTLPKTHELPSKSIALLLCGNALDDAGALIRVVHQSTFYDVFHRVYDVPYETFGDEEHKFLPLLYCVLALGSLFARADQSELHYQNAIDQGYHWFRVARQLIDITDCRDLTALQTVLYMILFLQSSARLNTCYAYLGVALRSSIRMGLHRSVSMAFNPVEMELRKRIFWIIRKLDIYVGALLGLPQMLSNDDIDQEMPIEVDDEYITTEKVLPMPPGKLSLFAAFNSHTRLVEILAKTAKYIYPLKSNRQLHGKTTSSYVVNHTKIREIEHDLQVWMEELPKPFRPGEEASPEFMRIRHLLRMAYAHIQMFLYRPFLHYTSLSVQSKHIDKRCYACGAACISVSRNIVQLTGQMKRKGLLVGSYWFYMYTTFFAIMSLVFYVLENPHGPEVDDILKDAYEGKDTLAALSAKSLAADRCSHILTELFDQLPSRLQIARDNTRNTSRKKRPASPRLNGTTSEILPSSPEITNDRIASSTEQAHPPSSRHVLQPSSASTEATALHSQTLPKMDPIYGTALQSPYSPSYANATAMQSLNSPSSSMPTNGDQSAFGTQNNFLGQDVPDLSAMMFPSGDPFAYPNQPMTTLENRQAIKQENPMDSGTFNLPGPTTTGAPYDNYNAQMYNQMPPYMMPGQSSGYPQGVNTSMGMTSAGSNTPSSVPQGFGAANWSLNDTQSRPSSTPGGGFDQLFGEDWGGFMNQYRQ